MSICTFAGDMRDFLRPATDAMVTEKREEGGEKGRRARRGGERDGEGRNEEERETVCLFLEAVTGRLIRSGPFHTPTDKSHWSLLSNTLYFLFYNTPLSIRGYLLRYHSTPSTRNLFLLFVAPADLVISFNYPLPRASNIPYIYVTCKSYRYPNELCQ